MKQSLLGCLALLAFTTSALAAAPATNAPPASPTPASKTTDNKTPAATPPPAPALAPAKSELKLDDYIKDLTAALKLTDTEKKKIEGYYVADGAQIKDILNNDALSPLQQARQVSDLRDTRNVKIAALLDDLDRQRAFLKIEARYRVALTELAANGGLVAAQPPNAK
jgi:hypothetical protein